MNENHETADATGAPLRATLILMGLAFIGAMAAPFFCGGTEGCRLGVLTLWSAFGWPARAGIAMLVAAGIWMILRVLGLRTLASIVGIGLLPLFAIMLNSFMFGLRAPACGPIIGAMRVLAEIPAYPACALWPTLTALSIDTFLIGLMLETLRKEFMPEASGNRLRPWTQGLMLLPLWPLLLPMLALLLPTVGSKFFRERWRRWWSG